MNTPSGITAAAASALGAELRAPSAATGVVAVDVGGTDMKTAVLDTDGRLIDVVRHATPRGDDAAEAIVDYLAGAVAEARLRHPDLMISAAGIGVPGLVDDEKGIARFASNLSWKDFPFRAAAEERIGLPVAFGHDVRAASIAERQLGAAQHFSNAAVVIIGTGIASTLIVDDHMLLSGGYAGELGHTIINPGGDPCACGGRGHLEGLAAASAIARRYTAATGTAVPGSREVLELATRGDAAAALVWTEAVDALALGLSQLVALTAPEAIVIGGGLAQAGDALFVPLAEALEAHLSFHRRPQLLRARLGENAGLLGTALAARMLAPQ
jgi:glucokinase